MKMSQKWPKNGYREQPYSDLDFPSSFGGDVFVNRYYNLSRV
jgi:hypothetical protein